MCLAANTPGKKWDICCDMEYARAYGAKYLNRTEEADRHLHAFNSVCEKIYGKYGKYFSAYQCQFSVKQHYEEITKNGPKVLIQ